MGRRAKMENAMAEPTRYKFMPASAVKMPAEYSVVRAWPGVTNGQRVVLHPDRAKRLIKGGFVEREK